MVIMTFIIFLELATIAYFSMLYGNQVARSKHQRLKRKITFAMKANK